MLVNKFTGAATAAILLAAGPAAAAIVTIDTFDTPQTVFDAPTDSVPQGSERAASEAIGGWRDLFVETDTADRIGATSLVASPDPQNSSDGILSFNNEDGVTGRGWVTYDGMDEGFGPDEVNTSGLGGLNFRDGAGAGFLFDVLRIDADIFIGITAWENGTDTTTSFGASVSETGQPFVSLDSFSNADFDWSNVGALQFFAQSGENSDVISLDGAISSISVDTGVVPVPAAGLLLLTGLGGMAVARKRRKSA